MQKEMACLTEAQKIREQWLSNSYRIKEERFDKPIDALPIKLKECEIVTKQHDDALSECKLYIESFWSNLKMLKIIKAAGVDEFILDDGLLHNK